MMVRPLGHACERREVEVARILVLEAKHSCAVPVLLQEPDVPRTCASHRFVVCTIYSGSQATFWSTIEFLFESH